MKIQQTTSDNGKAAIIKCDAPIDRESSAEVKQFAENLVNRGVQYIVVDAAQADHISSDGLTVIATLHRRLRAMQGLLIITGINNEIKTLFSLLGFSPELIIAASDSEAREMVERAGGGRFKDTFAPVSSGENTDTNINSSEKKEACRKEAGVPGSADIPEGETLFPQPLIVECEECCSFVRVHSSGTFLCPSCHAEFNVERDGTVIF